MPNRYVRAGILDSEAVNSLSESAEVFYRRLINCVDDFGRFSANLEKIRASLYPLKLDKYPAKIISKLLKECQDAGLVFVYAVDGKSFLVMNKWEQGRAKHSEYPAPDADTCQRMKTYVYTCKQMSAYAPDSDTDSDTDAVPDTGSGSASGSGGESADRPSQNEVEFYAERINLAKWKALDWFQEMEACGWKDHNGREVQKWQPMLARVKTKWEADGRPATPPVGKGYAANQSAPESVFAVKTKLEEVRKAKQRAKDKAAPDPLGGLQFRNEADKAEFKRLAALEKELAAKLTTT